MMYSSNLLLKQACMELIANLFCHYFAPSDRLRVTTATVAEKSQVCARPWITKSARQMWVWDSIADESHQKNLMWRQAAKKKHPKKRCFKNKHKCLLKYTQSVWGFGGNDWWFLWFHWSQNRFWHFQTWRALIKGQNVFTKRDSRVLSYNVDESRTWENQKRDSLRARPTKKEA